MKKFGTIIGGILGLIILIISIVGLSKGNLSLGIVSLIMFLVLIFFYTKGIKEPKLLPIKEIIDDYRDLMEENYRITLSEDVEMHNLEEPQNNEIYRVILKERQGDGTYNYYPFEANKYNKGTFGSGQGTILKNITEVEYWINKKAKVNVSQELMGNVQNFIKSEVNKELKNRSVVYAPRPEQQK